MKSRELGDGESRRADKRKQCRKNEQRMGGRGLSLQAFANAKSGPSGYNPSLIKKKREFYRNAKIISKFKKLLKREGLSENHHSAAQRLENLIESESELKPQTSKKQQKKKVSLQSLREEFEKKRAEEEKAKMEREAAIHAKKEERAKAEAKRKAQRDKMLKKTRSGQPVMKHRIEHMLGMLQNSTN